ncbi:PREDICTED: mastermind-like protein 2 [Nanorana parkeri]|uniref:mastermind-like protein 2 n=1 Tax=Nanorana parkeri TaxID=125878 RepID=UPI000854D832|nr:PREDICTED: mastermind-like protein 2 [Nanorana parkeri]
MGETAPPQAPAGSLGIGVSGVGLLGGGAAAPRLHTAIVERLRARIAVCRQHHLNCEGRYERSRVENTDRERENTLQLLTLVQHGQGTRKNSKHNKSTCAAPPDYRLHQQQQQLLSENGSDIGGDRHHQTSNNLGQRNPALVALQGSLKRRLVVNVSPTNSKRPNGVLDNSFLDFKKIRTNDRLSAGQNMYHGIDGVNQSVNGLLPMEQTLHRKNSNASSNCEANDLFNSTLKGIKQEPGENSSCGKNLDPRISHENSFRYGDDSGEQLMDPDLQELFSEFTYISVPPMSDLELQNMINITIKQDEPFNIDIDQHNQRNTATSAPLDKVIKTEYTQCMNHTRVGSPQIRPSSTGPTFSMSSSPLTSSPTTLSSQGQSQSPSCSNRLSNWQELSHAQQLKQIAANRQHNLIQQQQTNPSASWSNVPATGQSSRQYGMEKVPSPFRQQQLSPHGTSMSGASVSGNQPKTLNSYLYKNNSSAQSASLDMIKPQDSNKNSVSSSHLPEEHHHGLAKPLFHYSSEQTNQQASSGLVQQSKPMLPFSHQQNSTALQQHEQIQQVNSLTANQAIPRSGGFQQKMIISKMQQNQKMPGLQYPNVHPQQEQHANATQSPGSSTASCTSPNGYNNQQPLLNQQMVDKTNILQRQMMQQQMIARTEKCNGQDQLNRHLTRPPPDYKDQRRNTVGMQQPSQFPGGIQTVGAASDPPVTNATSGHITPQNPTHSSTSHASRITSVHGSPSLYGNVPCPQQNMYNNINQGQQQTSPNHMGTSPNGNVLPRQSTTTPGNNPASFGNPAGVNPPQFRPGLNHGNNSVGQRPPNIINNTTATQKWMGPEIKRQDMVSFTNNQFSNHSVQGVMGHHHFHQRGLSLPSQVNQGLQINQMTSASSGQSMEPLRGFNHGQSPQRSQILTNLSQAGGTATATTSTFNPTDQIPRAFPRSDSNNDLAAFDFISQNSGLGSSPNNDSDFIDVLLKTGHINDDWMKDINLDEIFKGHT